MGQPSSSHFAFLLAYILSYSEMLMQFWVTRQNDKYSCRVASKVFSWRL